MDAETFNLVTFVVAITSLVVSIASATWTMIAFRLSGPVVKVHSYGAVVGGGGGVETFYNVTAKNKGRQAVQVVQVSFINGRSVRGVPRRLKRFLPSRMAYMVTPKSGLWRVPVTLEAKHSESFLFPDEGVQEFARQTQSTRVTPMVALGDGTQVMGPSIKVL